MQAPGGPNEERLELHRSGQPSFMLACRFLEFSRRETEFFGTQSLTPRTVGSALSAEQRAGLIRLSRDYFAD